MSSAAVHSPDGKQGGTLHCQTNVICIYFDKKKIILNPGVLPKQAESTVAQSSQSVLKEFLL